MVYSIMQNFTLIGDARARGRSGNLTKFWNSGAPVGYSLPSPIKVKFGLRQYIHRLRLRANRYGPKIGGCAPLGERELGLHLIQGGQGRGLPACQVSSWSIQSFGHSISTSQTGQTGQDRQRSDSIGRTFLQTVAQKTKIELFRSPVARKLQTIYTVFRKNIFFSFITSTQINQFAQKFQHL